MPRSYISKDTVLSYLYAYLDHRDDRQRDLTLRNLEIIGTARRKQDQDDYRRAQEWLERGRKNHEEGTARALASQGPAEE